MPRNHFDLISGIYERWGHFDTNHPVMEMLDLPEHGIILDIGGGTGRVASALTGVDRRVVVIDISAGMLLKVRGKTGIVPLMSDSAALPLPAGRIDRVIVVDALHHIQRQKETIDEIHRLLKPGGVAVVIEPDLNALFVKLIVVLEFVLLMGSHFLNERDLLDLYKGKAGKVSSIVWRGNLIVKYIKD
ncbi:MAG: class I SAM-dependent methyltransferase [Anaerolineaceae bacterium]